MILKIYGHFINSEAIRRIYQDIEMDDMYHEPYEVCVIDLGFMNKVRIPYHTADEIRWEINRQLRELSKPQRSKK